MNEKQNKLTKVIKITTFFIIAAQAIMFFIPINIIKSDMVSYWGLWQKLAQVGWNDNIKLSLVVILSAIALIINLLSAISLFFVRTPKIHRNIALPSFLCASVIYAFCWGVMIDLGKFVGTLYGFDLIALILTISVITITLFIDETQIIKKEM